LPMNKPSLANLVRVEPREAWQSESGDFTPWLAQEQNFKVLADTLHFTEAEVETTERAIGSFSADIVARDRDGTILIENQLEQTDHTHLGQLLTYLAGLDGPVKVVWIATKIREEHRAAIDWLNANTPDEYAFFAVELEVYRIGESPAAPYFHVAARPNEWSRHARARTKELAEAPQNERQQRYVAFWSAVARYLSEHDANFTGASPPKDHWWSLGIGRTHFSLTLISAMRDKWIGAEVFLHKDEDKLIFDYFFAQRSAIESEFGSALEWERLDGQKGSRIAIRKRGVDPSDNERWPEFAAWYLDQMQRLRRCFAQRIRELDVDALRE
jgi:Domain of unknown function (DUF4268)